MPEVILKLEAGQLETIAGLLRAAEFHVSKADSHTVRLLYLEVCRQVPAAAGTQALHMSGADRVLGELKYLKDSLQGIEGELSALSDHKTLGGRIRTALRDMHYFLEQWR